MEKNFLFKVIPKVQDWLTIKNIRSRASKRDDIDIPDVLIHAANPKAGVFLCKLDETSIIRRGTPRVLNFPDAKISCCSCSYRNFVEDALLIDGSCGWDRG